MYCRECGSELLSSAEICVSCGCHPFKSNNYCQGCGAATNPQQELCVECGTILAGKEAQKSNSYTGFWPRLAAYVIDYIFIFVAQSILIILFAILLAGAELAGLSIGDGPISAILGFIILLIFIIVQAVYYIIMNASKWQGTLGKLALGIKITDTEGNRITTGRSIARYFAFILSAFTLLIGFIMAAFTSKKQALHDMIAGTLVVKK